MQKANRKVKLWSAYYRQILQEVGDVDPDHQPKAKQWALTMACSWGEEGEGLILVAEVTWFDFPLGTCNLKIS